ncbi:hypothetical protein [Bradyrhizobium sp. U531]|uniref:hypothetical protein n=1 Tax=Bradyrhizobium sp. U531 TaxID=3053458 RepID=UPI003F687CB5
MTRIVNGHQSSDINHLLPLGLPRSSPQSRGLRTTLTAFLQNRILCRDNFYRSPRPICILQG